MLATAPSRESFNPMPLETPEPRCWYAIRTRSRHERVAFTQLQSQQIEAFLPVIKQVHKWSDRSKAVEAPLFAGYAFVRVSLTSRDRLRVLQTHGVVGFVGVNGVGIPVPDSQIQDLQTLLASKVPFHESSCLRVGQRVRIKGGALHGVEGILAAQNGDRSVVITVEPIQRSLWIRIEGYGVEAI